ncbi:MAG: type III-B CRISPR module-associated protein Cmr5 [Hydrogenobaculum sp.]
MKTLEQERSNYAFECISRIKGKNFEKDASSLIAKLGTLILTNGLGNTLAFLFSKAKNHHLETIVIISNWLYKLEGQNKQVNSGNVKEKIDQIMRDFVLDVDVEKYIYYTDETLRLINWLRRFSDAMLESGGGNND